MSDLIPDSGETLTSVELLDELRRRSPNGLVAWELTPEGNPAPQGAFTVVSWGQDSRRALAAVAMEIADVLLFKGQKPARKT